MAAWLRHYNETKLFFNEELCYFQCEVWQISYNLINPASIVFFLR